MPSPQASANPFYQPARQWQIRVFCARDQVSAIEETFADLALATLSFEQEAPNQDWCVDCITDVPPENTDLSSRLALVSGLLGVPTPRCDLRVLEPRDWVSEVERSFAPISAGRFYVRGSHAPRTSPCGSIPLGINAGAAFGSGEHATTRGCLLALEALTRKRRFLRPLDMGSGSGILAIALAKLWRRPVIAVDIDPVSVRVGRANARMNGVDRFITFAAGDGYSAVPVRRHAPFDLIVANILARPLARMAPDLARHLAPGGMAILSGLLVSQERTVLAAHRAQGLTLRTRLVEEGWSTLILEQRIRHGGFLYDDRAGKFRGAELGKRSPQKDQFGL